ncbi:MAG: NAD(P)H-hydrate dehydratase [Oscillospiraceae bacterium]|nr:NAD(P)H-hydrate dehydratase [Oscillospiraceae bacterium]
MICEITKKDISLPKRASDAHKGNFGRILLICGSKKYTGAAFFAAQSAVNTGSGLVFLSIPEEIRPILATKLNEPVLISRDECDMKSDATLIGCGCGLGDDALSLLKRELSKEGSPLVIDADAITLMARHNLSFETSRELVLTPHEGEFMRLVPDFDNSRREEFASNFAKRTGCLLVLKGHRTITATKNGELFINTTGNPGMAKGGSGDVLAGIITSLIGQGIPCDVAAYTAVWLHGRAGDIAAEKYGEYSMTPTDMLCTLKSAICEVHKTYEANIP